MARRLIGRMDAALPRAQEQATPTDESVLRLAVLLQAGIAPARAWGHLAESGNPDAMWVQDAVARGIPLADAIADAGPPPAGRRRGDRSSSSGSWREVAGAWRVATIVGAPLAVSLRALATALRDAQEAADDVRVALAEPAGTARLIGWLPLVALALGAGLGFDTFRVLLATPAGLVCLALGIALIVAARRWNASLVRRATPGLGIPGLDAELLAIALSGGVSLDRATAIVEEAAGTAIGAECHGVLALSRSAGAPAVELLRATASLARHRARVDGRIRASQLSSRLLLPLGVCTLPAFLLLGVAPMLLSVMATTPLSL